MAVLKRLQLFDSLSENLGGILDRLTRRGALSEADVDEGLREVRRALLEADVALDVARAFTDNIKKQAIGVEVMKSVSPARWSSRSCTTSSSRRWARKVKASI